MFYRICKCVAIETANKMPIQMDIKEIKKELNCRKSVITGQDSNFKKQLSEHEKDVKGYILFEINRVRN